MSTSEFHPATAWEAIADALGEVPAVVQGDRSMTWAELDAAASGLAGHLEACGVGAEQSVAVYLHNSPEFLVAYLAAWKLRARPVNVNYRYVSDELAYLLADSEATALVFGARLADRVAEVDAATLDTAALAARVQVPDSPGVSVLDGSTGWGAAVAHQPAVRRDRPSNDVHLLYTGGTTGLPKGVMYDVGGLGAELIALGAPVLGSTPPSTIDELVALAASARDTGTVLRSLVLPPLMHGTGMALAMITLYLGGTVVLQDGVSFDPKDAVDLIDRHQVKILSIVGDAFARPMAEVLEPADARVASLGVIMSSGAMLSSEIKHRLLAAAPGAMVVDTLAASEGAMGSAISVAGAAGVTGSFSLREGAMVLDDDDQPVLAGSGIVGRLAVRSTNPVGYFKDPVKTASTFRVIDGERFTFPGDMATVLDDGSVQLLGRGSHCINTGGEKVFPEEVEEALKTHDTVRDALVFGVDDERWGQRIEAVVSVNAPVEPDVLVAHVRQGLAPYKSPKRITIVDDVPRAPNGKADYGTARDLAGVT